jgi:dihydroorotate dehydrogenase electron transfer subunit
LPGNDSALSTPAQQHAQRNRGSIFVEDGEVLSCEAWPGEQFVMRVRAPKCAAAAQPGSFAHISCDSSLPMRRPLSIMRTGDNWIELLFKVVGHGLGLLGDKQPGDIVSVLGPIGQPFRFSAERPNALLIGGGVGIPPMVFIADHLRSKKEFRPLAILGSEIPFPFELQASQLETPWLDDEFNSAMPLLEDWRVPSRLTSLAGFEGCFEGYVTDLAEKWFDSLSPAQLAQTEVYACGPTPMLKAVAAQAQKYGVPCQVSLEEFMACAVGGCAGCAVKIETPDGPAMKRVCVDGPVFDASSVVWD